MQTDTNVEGYSFVIINGDESYIDLDSIIEELDTADPCYVVDGPDLGGES